MVERRPLHDPRPDSFSLTRYDAACRALAEAKRVDEVKEILNVAAATKEYARRAKNRQMEEDAIEIRMRAARRLDELIKAQKQTVGLAQGTRGSKIKGARVDDKPTVAEAGIDKNLAHQARVFGAMDHAAFEQKIVDARGSVSRVFRRAVREVEIAQERVERRARTDKGGSVADLHALIASGYRAGVISIDVAWPFEGWSERSGRRVTDHYETMTLDEIKALPIRALAADDCAVFCWVIWPLMPFWYPVLEAWDVTYSGLAFDWVKLTPDGERLHKGTGHNTRQNPEPCILAKVGSPLRLDENVDAVITEPELIVTPVGAHSEKPDEAIPVPTSNCSRASRVTAGAPGATKCRPTKGGNECTALSSRRPRGSAPWRPRSAATGSLSFTISARGATTMGEVVPLRPPKKFRVTVNREAVQLVSFTVEAADN